MSRRSTARREIKRRGSMPSFGDIILPIVSIAAVGLLVIAGRQFFLNGIKTSPGISSTRAYAEAPALIAEREKKSGVEISDSQVNGSEKEIQTLSADIAEKVKAEEEEILNLAVAVQTSKPVAQVQSKPTQTPAKKVSTPAPAKKTTPSKSTVSPVLSMSQQWRVQIGAYTTRSGAQEAANKIKKAGYKAIVYSNPASKHFKVWVQGGADRKSAEKVITAMQKLGYKGSFAFPPAKKQ